METAQCLRSRGWFTGRAAFDLDDTSRMAGSSKLCCLWPLLENRVSLGFAEGELTVHCDAFSSLQVDQGKTLKKSPGARHKLRPVARIDTEARFRKRSEPSSRQWEPIFESPLAVGPTFYFPVGGARTKVVTLSHFDARPAAVVVHEVHSPAGSIEVKSLVTVAALSLSHKDQVVLGQLL